MIEAEGAGFVVADWVGVEGVGDLGFEPGGPVGGVDEEAAEPWVFEVDGGADGGADDAAGFTVFVLVVAEPDEGLERIVFGALGGRVFGFHAGDDLAADEDLGCGREFVDAVDIGWAPDGGDPFEERVGGEVRVDDAAGAFGAVVAVVADPCIADDLLAEAAWP